MAKKFANNCGGRTGNSNAKKGRKSRCAKKAKDSANATSGRKYVPAVASKPLEREVGKLLFDTSAGNIAPAKLCSNMEAALDYAQRGLPVFPLAPQSKRPLAGSHGYRDATTDPNIIQERWKQNPDYNIAIATGDDLIIIDIDNGERGKASFEKLSQILGTLPPTVTVLTGNGWHLYYRTNRVLPDHVGLADSVDVRGAKGHAVAPPSLHPSCRSYRFAPGRAFDEIEIAQLPPNWVTLLGLGGASARTGYYSKSPWSSSSYSSSCTPAIASPADVQRERELRLETESKLVAVLEQQIELQNRVIAVLQGTLPPVSSKKKAAA